MHLPQATTQVEVFLNHSFHSLDYLLLLFYLQSVSCADLCAAHNKSIREDCSALTIMKDNSRSGNLVEKPQSAITLWRALVPKRIFSCLELQKSTAKALSPTRKKALKWVHVPEDE